MSFKSTSLLLLVFIFLSLKEAAAQKDTLFNQNDNQGKKHGWWKGTNEQGQLTYKGYFEHGQPRGTFFRYYEDSTIKAKLIYSADGRKVETTLYYNDGDIAAAGNYLDSQKDSTWKFYSFYSGTLSAEESYRIGQREGLSRKFYESGQLLEELLFNQDKKNGQWIQYYKNGKPSLSAIYQNDLRNGKYNTWYESGQKEIDGLFVNNLMEGTWKYYDESGKVKFMITYKSGVAQGQSALEEEQQSYFKKIEDSKGKFPEPDETNFIPTDRH